MTAEPPAKTRPFSFHLQSAPRQAILARRCRKSSSIIRTSAFQVFTSMMRGLSASRFDSLTAATFDSRYFRHREAEFSVTSQNTCDLSIFRQARVTNGVPNHFGALRSINHSLNIRHKHELSFFRETLAAFARRVPTQGRPPRAAGTHAGESAKENILATLGCIFRKRQKREQTGRVPERRSPTPGGA